MGYVTAREIRSFLGEDRALHWHLQFNFYPAVSLTFLPVVRRAVALARAEQWQTTLQLSTGFQKSVREICQDLHLEAFLDEEDHASAAMRNQIGKRQPRVILV